MQGDLFSPPDSPPPKGGPYARVVPERGIDFPDGLTYSIPQELRDLSVGERVRAPLGRGNKLVEGVVVEIVTVPDIDPGKIKPIASRVTGRARAGRRSSKGTRAEAEQPSGGQGPKVPGALIELARWMARYYCSPIGMVLASMVPAAVKQRTGAVRRTLVQPATSPADDVIASLSAGAASVWKSIEGIERESFPMSARDLADRIGSRTIAPINRLIRAGVLREVEREEVRAVWESLPVEEAAPPELTPEQARAVEAIDETRSRFAPHLLYGVTGSGKTEVYLRVLERVLARGECGIVLVPEISLTPQTVARFVARFGGSASKGAASPAGEGRVAALHSGLTAAQRHHQWARIASGEARIVVGARSAVFAPFDAQRGSRLGVIIVDEEHDSSYKQDQLPRYHARDVALKRGQIESCPVVLGSATPSLESWLNAQGPEQRIRPGPMRFTLHELPRRVGGGSLPPVRIVDLVEDQRRRHRQDRALHALSLPLEQALARTLEEGGQAILLLNRRGYASYICCTDPRCGWIMQCPDCDVTVVFHRAGAPGSGQRPPPGFVRCHHCQLEQKLPPACPMCGRKINPFGFGTQRLEEELLRKFPSLAGGERGPALQRFDADTMHRAHDYNEALSRFASGEIRVLLGTQMIAKGLDFPNVSLIGVINADTALNLPDFRSSERTFQLVAQVAGRAGRSATSGRKAQVLVQTFNPKEPAIVAAAAHDYRGFAERELAARRMAALPPVTRMARIVCRDRDAAKAEAEAGAVAKALREAIADAPGFRVHGPMPCVFTRIAQHYRFAVELVAGSAGDIQRVLAGLRSRGVIRSDAHTAVDVDPVALM